MSPDLINGLFELVGGGFILRNCLLTWRAKKVAGVSILTTTFFAAWGLWNCIYYLYLDQWWSFSGGLVIVAANALWIYLMLYYLWWVPRQLETGRLEAELFLDRRPGGA